MKFLAARLVVEIRLCEFDDATGDKPSSDKLTSDNKSYKKNNNADILRQKNRKVIWEGICNRHKKQQQAIQ
ncbi:hypothetical protein DXX92_02110 [Thalassotalea euphylliae]|uniref:Uncharacterized protein n=1 Tax=Thalassotalea euphylliae TaxID=1655234 RepID=A0A3E0UBX8_9GAMM|nr:hypothetical protein DXX92_02110 [Thalassotalea euphylliae]